MKKAFAALVALGFLTVGCGVREHEVPEAPTVDELLEEAWKKYRTEADYEGAWALFDSVIVVDAYYAEAHMGAGFCAAQLGSYTDAFGSFSLASILTGPLFRDTIFSEYLDTTALGGAEPIVDTSWDPTGTVWRYRLRYPADTVLGVEELTVAGVTQKVVAFGRDGSGNLWIYVEGARPFASPEDTLLRFAVRAKCLTGVASPDFESWYGTYGLATAYLSYADDYEIGTEYSRCAWLTVSALDAASVPGRVSSSIPVPSQERLGYLLAYHYFKGGYYANAVDVLHRVDPSWPSSSWDMNNYPDYNWAFDPANQRAILEKIQGGLAGSF